MPTYTMVFIAPVPNASRGGKQAWELQSSQVQQPIALKAGTDADARTEAAAIWAGMVHARFQDPDGYWVTDEHDKLVDHQERDEPATPRAAGDLAQVAAFKRMVIAAGGGLVLVERPEPAPLPGFECDLDGLDLLHDAEDRLDLADLVEDAGQRALIARHPAARDPAQLERTLDFLAGTRANAGTVGDLQRAWLASAAGLAAMAEAGLLITAEAELGEVRRAA